jgi:hypothetical protein
MMAKERLRETSFWRVESGDAKEESDMRAGNFKCSTRNINYNEGIKSLKIRISCQNS